MISHHQQSIANDAIRIGDWTFSPGDASLTRGGERRRLEHRAARVLEFLHGHRGATVSTEQLIASVWEGRTLSHNSVSVVIGDLRRALGDDSRKPRYIETVAKRGYRLAVPVDSHGQVTAPASVAPKWSVRAIHLTLIAALLAAVVIGLLVIKSAPTPAPVAVSIERFVNETGSSAHDPLVPAVSELATAHLAGVDGIEVVSAPAQAQWHVSGSIVLWNGQVSLSMRATDRRTGKLLWSVIAVGPASQLPRQMGKGFDYFQQFVRENQAGGGSTPVVSIDTRRGAA